MTTKTVTTETGTTETPTTAQQAGAAAFTARVLGDTATVVLAALGDRLGLFASLAADGPATSGELAARTGTDERYVREWAAGLVAAGYLERDAVDGRIALPAPHVPTLAQEAGPAFFGGVHQELLGALQCYHRIADAFRSGGGVPPAELHEDVWLGTERFTAGWHRHLLVPQWLPLMPEVQHRLRGGARIAGVGCGAGHAAVALATAFPASTVTGYDLHAPVVERARRRAAEAGVDDRVSWHHRPTGPGTIAQRGEVARTPASREPRTVHRARPVGPLADEEVEAEHGSRARLV